MTDFTILQADTTIGQFGSYTIWQIRLDDISTISPKAYLILEWKRGEYRRAHPLMSRFAANRQYEELLERNRGQSSNTPPLPSYFLAAAICSMGLTPIPLPSANQSLPQVVTLQVERLVAGTRAYLMTVAINEAAREARRPTRNTDRPNDRPTIPAREPKPWPKPTATTINQFSQKPKRAIDLEE